MAWTYVQRTGELWHSGVRVAIGYAGADDGDGLTEPGEGRNLPGAEAISNVGPLPTGRYIIGPVHDHPVMGSRVMYLDPHPDNIMYGRSGFFIHGGNPDGSSSHGCIVLGRGAREMIATSTDRELVVVAEAPSSEVA